jgi:hypothetical protein
MDAGLLKDGDPEVASITMWAHAHGLIQLYHHGAFPVTQDEFRNVFQLSSKRLMTGLATEEFSRTLENMECGPAVQPEGRTAHV